MVRSWARASSSAAVSKSASCPAAFFRAPAAAEWSASQARHRPTFARSPRVAGLLRGGGGVAVGGGAVAAGFGDPPGLGGGLGRVVVPRDLGERVDAAERVGDLAVAVELQQPHEQVLLAAGRGELQRAGEVLPGGGIAAAGEQFPRRGARHAADQVRVVGGALAERPPQRLPTGGEPPRRETRGGVQREDRLILRLRGEHLFEEGQRLARPALAEQQARPRRLVPGGRRILLGEGFERGEGLLLLAAVLQAGDLGHVALDAGAAELLLLVRAHAVGAGGVGVGGHRRALGGFGRGEAGHRTGCAAKVHGAEPKPEPWLRLGGARPAGRRSSPPPRPPPLPASGRRRTAG